MTALPPFQAIYDQHSELVFNLCLHYLQVQEDAEDATQQVFLKIHRELPRFRRQASLKTWIYRLTINQCLDLLKARKRQKRFAHLVSITPSDKEGISPNLIGYEHPGAQLEDKEAVARIFFYIDTLPPQQKTALILKVIEGLSQKEIATIMNISPKAVESLLSRARRTLKKKLPYPEGITASSRQTN